MVPLTQWWTYRAFKRTKETSSLGLTCGWEGREGEAVLQEMNAILRFRLSGSGPERQNLLGHINH